ncbi:MAG: hypothetical protein ACE5GW_09430 [Planctomycetota bacterium]
MRAGDPQRDRSRRRAPGLSLCITLLILVTLSACRVAPPKASVEGRHSLVRAESPEVATLLAPIADVRHEQIRGLLPDTLAERVEIWVQEELAVLRSRSVDDVVSGMTVRGGGKCPVIHLRRDDPAFRATLVHELVHRLLGRSWEPLPMAVEEGLCEVVACRLEPDAGLSLRVSRLKMATASAEPSVIRFRVRCLLPIGRMGSPHRSERSRAFHGGTTLDFSLSHSLPEDSLLPAREALGYRKKQGTDFVHAPPSITPALYGCGFLVAHRIVERSGFEGLHRLCEEASLDGLDRIPAGRLLQAAGLEGSPRAWRQAILDEVGEDETFEWMWQHREELLEAFRGIIVGRRYSPLTAEEFLHGADPRLSIIGKSRGEPLPSVRLRDRPRFRKAMEQLFSER